LRFLKEVACPCAAAFVHHSLAFVVSQIHVQQTPHFLINFPQQTTNDDIQIKEEPKEDQISSNSQWL
jgi:hypothetical protein